MGNDLWRAVKYRIEAAGFKWENFASLATDRAPSIVGRDLGLVARLKGTVAEEGVPTNLPAIHCILHYEALCCCVVKFKHVMDVVVKTVNFIRSRGLNHRLFADFLQNLDATYKDLPYHTQVRWFSRGKVLQRFFDLRDEIKEFLHNKGKEFLEMANPEWLRDLAFFVDN
ncbi:general transcription factor II-I repeat domain-containing protein 2B-like [Ornithodoros turicata]|uniref:general transcription factor II-I repeat domain-containing protein 2B-like n=1 Tax=Ornithodoros turicata TaxID=34597 RepID=UPI0031394078